MDRRSRLDIGIVLSWVNYHDEMRQWIKEVMPSMAQPPVLAQAAAGSGSAGSSAASSSTICRST